MSAKLAYSTCEAENTSPHIPTIGRWLSENWGVAMGYSLEETTEWCEEVAGDQDETIFITTKQDQLVGTAMVLECDLEGHEHLTPWLSSLYVPATERGNDIGELLIKATCDWARERNFPTIYLYAHIGKLISYYELQGWEGMGSEFELDDGKFQLMQKSIAAA